MKGKRLIIIILAIMLIGLVNATNISITSPSETIDFGKSGIILDLNWTLADYNISSITSAHGVDMTLGGSEGGASGARIIVNELISNQQVIIGIAGNTTIDTCYLTDENEVTLEIATRIGDTCSFDYDLVAGTTYLLLTNRSDGANFERNITDGGVSNITSNLVNWTSGWAGGGTSTSLRNIVSLTQTSGNCWYNYNYTNSSVNCISNHTTFTSTTQKNLTFYANNSEGNITSKLIEWNYNIFLNELSYNPIVISGTIGEFSVNITYLSNFSGISGLLNYNNTNYTMSSNSSGDNKLYSYELPIPSFPASTTQPFYFIFLLSNETGTKKITSENYNQTVSPFLIDNCVSYTNVLLNLKMYDEEDLSEVNGTININVNIYSYGTTTLVNSYNTTFDYSTTASSRICLANITQNYTLAYEIQHYADDNVENVSYFKKYRNIQAMTISNTTIPQNLSLYNLLSTSGKTFDIIVVGNLLSSVGNSNLLVDTQRQYIGLNQFKSVESSVTSSSGVAVTHLVQSDEVYNFIITYNGAVLGTFNNYRVKCQNELSGQCSITLNLAQATTTLPDFQNYGNIAQVILLDNTLHILYHTFTSTDGESHTVRSLVLKDDGYANTTICDNTASGTSGTIQCSIPTIYQNTTFFVQTFVDGDYIGSKYFSQGVTQDWKGADIFILMLMFTSMVLLLIGHPILIVIGAIIGMISPILLLYVAGGSFGAIIGTVLFYIAGGILVIWQISRRL